jgi:dihydrofolate reductase
MTQRIAIIGAVSINSVYGEGGKIPWHFKEDMEYFKMVTSGHVVAMGRGTWESLPKKFRPLPDRVNLVITNTPNYQADGAKIVHSVQCAISEAKGKDIFFIGGADIWISALRVATDAYITVVNSTYPVKETTRCAPELNDASVQLSVFTLCHISEVIAYEKESGRSILIDFKHWKRIES